MDKLLLWHPYTQHGFGERIIHVSSASGAYIFLSDGGKLLDAISSWWVNIHGHSHPVIAEAIATQAKRLDHVMFAGFTHEPAVTLASLLIGGARDSGAGVSRVFYSDNGSTAVEVALKLAYQFHINGGERRRSRFLALRHAYHGDTFGAMAAGEPEGFHSVFRPLLPTVDFVNPGDLDALRALLRTRGGEYAAFIFEPLLQGAGGMRIYQKDFLKEAMDLCWADGILTIADEVFTGFYRTGKRFAFEHAGISPDMIVLSKGITGGFMPLGATLVSEDIYSAFYAEDMRLAFLHGHSYTANPIACAAAVASWGLLEDASCQQRIAKISEITAERTTSLCDSGLGMNARCFGTIGAVELKGGPDYFSAARRDIVDKATELGVLLRPLGKVIYAVPPFCVTDDEVNRIYDVMAELLA